MQENQHIYIGQTLGNEKKKILFPLKMANRHGLIAGASGTGKTITMKVLAEAFSDAGVPVFVCDMKGDVSGLAEPGRDSESMQQRILQFGLEEVFAYRGYPCTFWDVYQANGHPVRITVSDLGPDLLSRLLELTPAQDGVLHILFQIADDKGLILDDMKDLKAMLDMMTEKRTEFSASYGNISAQSIGAIKRAVLPLEQQGGNLLFGLPSLDVHDWMKTVNGQGMINILDCTQLGMQPLLYSAFMLWLMSELFEVLPEAGDLERPKMVLFFDEAHLIFKDAPKALVAKIEQVVKLIRSKGVGIYFVSQSPSDIPDAVLAQLSSRFQHALRAYTPADQKAVKAAAKSLRPNPSFQAEDVISSLGVGQALVSVLDEQGIPGMVEQAAILCPQSLMGPASASAREHAMQTDGMTRYDETLDRTSASEMLEEQKARDAERQALQAEREALEKEKAALAAQKAKEEEAARKKAEKEAEAARKKAEREAEKAQAAKERAAQRRKEKIENQIFSIGGSLLRRTIMNTLKKR